MEAVVDTGQGVQTFDIVATRAGRRIEVTTARGIVEVTEVTRGGTPVRTGRFMASRLVALVEHPAVEGDTTGVDVTTRRRMAAPDEEARGRRGRSRHTGAHSPPRPAERGGRTDHPRSRQIRGARGNRAQPDRSPGRSRAAPRARRRELRSREAPGPVLNRELAEHPSRTRLWYRALVCVPRYAARCAVAAIATPPICLVEPMCWRTSAPTLLAAQQAPNRSPKSRQGWLRRALRARGGNREKECSTP